ncbi:MAG: hypothetical protein ACOH2T_19230 [Pseudomonas sp.]
MNLGELYQKLSYGPLQELAIAGEGSGNVPSQHQPRMTLATNAALNALYTIFPLQTKTIVIETIAGIHSYPLRRKHALTDPDPTPLKFIKDLGSDPFLGDVLRVDGIYDREHRRLPVNERGNEYSWFVPAFDTVAMDYPLDNERYFLEYRARHPELTADGDPAEQAIQLPFELQQALLHHIAHTIYGGMSMEGALAKSQNHISAFEAQVAMHDENNTFNQSWVDFNVKPQLRGWI